MPETLLALEGVRAGYGDAVVLDDISFEIPQHQSLAVLGRNGVGKSTLLLTIMGHTKLSRGTISLRGKDITALTPHLRPRRGLGWVAQEREVFPSLSVEENLTVAARPGRWTLGSVFDLFPLLAERRQSRGNHLSGGEQQMLAVGRGLMTNPSLLLLDEPLEGLAPIIVEQVTHAIRRMIADEGMTIVLVEQHADIALALTEHAVVLERGRIVHRASSCELLADPALLDRYVGLEIAESAGADQV